MTYTERSQELARNASIAVLVLLSHDNLDMEFWPLGFGSQSDWTSREEFAARRLRSVGVVGLGLPGLKPLVAFKEALLPSVVDGIATAFLAYLNVLLADSFAEQLPGAETAELERMWSLRDPRMDS